MTENRIEHRHSPVTENPFCKEKTCLEMNTNKLCVNSEKTSVKVVFCSHVSERIFYPSYKPPQNPLQSWRYQTTN